MVPSYFLSTPSVTLISRSNLKLRKFADASIPRFPRLIGTRALVPRVSDPRAPSHLPPSGVVPRGGIPRHPSPFSPHGPHGNPDENPKGQAPRRLPSLPHKVTKGLHPPGAQPPGSLSISFYRAEGDIHQPQVPNRRVDYAPAPRQPITPCKEKCKPIPPRHLGCHKC